MHVIILNWNQWRLTADCIKSLQQTAQLPVQPTHIVVVDNGSLDGSVEQLQAEFGEQITLLRNAENLGYAGGNNVGIRYALAQGATHIMVLNNDTLAGPNLFEPLMTRLESDPHIGVVAPKIYFVEPTNRIWAIGGTINWWLGTAHSLDYDKTDKGQFNTPRQLDYATGCCFLARRDVFTSVGLFDEAFFAYFEDADWSVRAHQQGWQIWYEPNATLQHWAGASGKPTDAPRNAGNTSSFVYYLVARNNLWFLRRHAKRIQLPIAISLFMLRHVFFYTLAFIALRRWAKLRQLWRGVAEGFGSMKNAKIVATNTIA